MAAVTCLECGHDRATFLGYLGRDEAWVRCRACGAHYRAPDGYDPVDDVSFWAEALYGGPRERRGDA
jgi:transcription elongation factor Elf1